LKLNQVRQGNSTIKKTNRGKIRDMQKDQPGGQGTEALGSARYLKRESPIPVGGDRGIWTKLKAKSRDKGGHLKNAGGTIVVKSLRDLKKGEGPGECGAGGKKKRLRKIAGRPPSLGSAPSRKKKGGSKAQGPTGRRGEKKRRVEGRGRRRTI